MAPLATAARAQGVAPKPWSAPLVVGDRTRNLDTPAIVFADRGRALLSWVDSGGGAFPTHYAGDNYHQHGRIGTWAAGTATQVTRVRDSIFTAPAAAGDHLLVARTYVLAADGDLIPRERVRISEVSVAGRILRTRELTHDWAWGEPVLAANSRGDAVIAWVEWKHGPDGDGTQILHAALIRPGLRFSRPVVLRRQSAYLYDGGGQVAAAMDSSGKTVIAFAAHQRVDAFVRPSGGSFGRRHVIGRLLDNATFAARFAPNGRAYVAWGSIDGGEECNEPWTVRVAELAPGRLRFSPAHVLDPGSGRENCPSDRVAIATSADGSATVGWSSLHGGYRRAITPVMVASSNAAGRFGPATQLAPDASFGDVATGPDGTTIAVWTAQQGSGLHVTSQVIAAQRGPGEAAFAPPEAIAPPGAASDPRIAFDPGDGRPTVIWGDRASGEEPTTGVPRDAQLRISTRGG